MNRILISLFLLLLLFAGAPTKADPQTTLESAKFAVIKKELSILGDQLLALLKRYLPAEYQNANLKQLLIDKSPIQKSHKIFDYCKGTECEWLLQSYAKLKLEAAKMQGISLPFEELISYHKLIHQGKKAMLLSACILLDTLSLFEKSLQKPGEETKHYLDQLEKSIRKFKESTQKIQFKESAEIANVAHQNAGVTSCDEASLAYRELRRRLKNLKLSGQSLDETQNITEHLFFENLLTEKLKRIKR